MRLTTEHDHPPGPGADPVPTSHSEQAGARHLNAAQADEETGLTIEKRLAVMGWLKKAIGSPKQARRGLEDMQASVRRPKKDEVAAQRQKKQQGGAKK